MIVTYFQAVRRTTFTEWSDSMVDRTFRFLKKNVPMVQQELQKEEDKMEESLTHDLKDAKRTRTMIIPKKGRTAKALLADLNKRGKVENQKWEKGLVSGAVYCGEKEHTELLSAAYAAFSLSNPLHPDIWPSVNQFEAEIVSMCCNLMNGTMNGTNGNKEAPIVDTVVGCLTSGGTESIVLAAKSHREFYCKDKGIKYPEIISCVTAHAAIDKACEILGIRHVRVGYNPKTYKIDLDQVRRAITSDTIMIYSSAPSFPQGVVDSITELSKLAVSHDVGLHVDCCLGGFVLPFAKKAGYDVPEFDFTLPGVTSMSCDTHKYGYASKGTSVVMYRNSELRRSQYFCYPKWTGGLYVTPTIAGSRPGALSAACWASMMAMGEDGYTERVQNIMDTTQWIAERVNDIEGLYLLGDPKAMIVCFGSKDYNIYRVGDKMSKMGWSLNSLQKPSCIHICTTLRTVEHRQKFIDDLQSVVDEVLEEGDDGKLEGNAAIYGMSGSMPPGPVNELLCCYTDVILKA
jgi:glutamate/tyrosine decarboxylase-like PLP-dependent enzyme